MPKGIKESDGPDGRVDNARPLAYDEPKKQRSVHLTETAWKWYQAMGGNDWVEKQARSKAPF